VYNTYSCYSSTPNNGEEMPSQSKNSSHATFVNGFLIVSSSPYRRTPEFDVRAICEGTPHDRTTQDFSTVFLYNILQSDYCA
jgi:hypothetical protein